MIAGGSVAGCTLATLLGRQGVRVTVLEKTVKPDHYKVVCTHFIQAGATPVIERLGLAGPMEAAGAVRNGLEVFSDAGWYRTPDDCAYGYSLRRSKLDPMLRELAEGTPNVELRRGVTVTDAAARRRPARRPARPHRRRRGGRGPRQGRRRRRRPRLAAGPAGRHPRPRPAPQPLRLHGLLRGPADRDRGPPLAVLVHRGGRDVLYCLPQRRRRHGAGHVPAQRPPAGVQGRQGGRVRRAPSTGSSAARRSSARAASRR